MMDLFLLEPDEIGEVIVPTFSDSTPYTFRAVPQDAGNLADIPQIIGGSLVWNQLALGMNALRSTMTQSGDSYTFVPTGTALTNAGTSFGGGIRTKNNEIFAVTGNHVYMFTATLDALNVSGACTIYLFGDVRTGSKTAVANDRFATIMKAGASATYGLSFLLVKATASTFAESDSFTCSRPQLIDLTAMFGPTIADYIYSLEQSTAGAGVAWVKQYVPNDYYPYHEPSIESVNMSAHETVGFNQWDEEWEVGSYNMDTGAPLEVSNRIRGKNPFDVFPEPREN